jgi:site-specific DNA-methyltransferase (adenine-specific)
MADYKLLLGDCLEKLKELPDNSVDSVVTDPPYELGFMGKKWDNTGIAFNEDLWKECLRVLKPGGHLLSAGGTRTYHRMTCAIEDAGFEVRDSIQWWHYGSGFPKSHNIGKAVDKIAGREGTDIITIKEKIKELYNQSGKSVTQITKECGFNAAGYIKTESVAPDPWVYTLPSLEKWYVIENVLGLESEEIRQLLSSAERELVGTTTSGIGKAFTKEGWASGQDIVDITKGNSEYEGWGTALKPAGEPFISATKEGGDPMLSDEPGFFYGAKVAKKDRNEGLDAFEEKANGIGSTYAGNQKTSNISGNPDRQTDPKKNNHPTVKPTNLMRYLVKLVTPVGGTVLDPFMGSGSTGKACMIEGFNFIGIEREKEYMDIAEARIKNAKELVDKK